MYNKDFKELRKAAFSIAIGASLGKFTADIIINTISGIGLGIFNFVEKSDDKIAGDLCKKANVNIESEHKTSNKVIGFHVE